MNILLQAINPATSSTTAKAVVKPAPNSKPLGQSSTTEDSSKKQLRDKTAINITPSDFWVLLVITLVAGGLGGWYNYRRTTPPKPQDSPKQSDPVPPNTGRSYLITCLLGGVIACALIPLFLQTIQSQLLNNPTLGDFTVFVGLCLIAAISSNAFIDTLTKRVLDEINGKADAALKNSNDANKKADTNSEIIKPIVKSLADVPLQASQVKPKADGVIHPPNQLRDIILKPSLNFRSVEGVINESGQSESDVQAVFDDLAAQKEVKLVDVGGSSKVYLIKP